MAKVKLPGGGGTYKGPQARSRTLAQKARNREASWSAGAKKKVDDYMALEHVNRTRAITLLESSGKIKKVAGEWQVK
jgi:hypothetical protein